MFLRIVGLRGGGRVPNLAGCVAQMSNHGTGNMMTIRTLIVIICITCLASLALAQGAPTPAPVPVAPADAKNHVGTLAIVCGKAVDAQIGDPGMSGYGKPVTFDIDEPPPKPIFTFVTFGVKPGGFPEAHALVAALKGKQVCVTGKIMDGPFIFAPDRSQVKLQNGK
jgi:hypothetical protein